jgi:putative oxidoreductase
MKNSIALSQLFLRITLGVSFLAACFDRFGWIAPYGSPNVDWGDWKHFSIYAHQIMPFVSNRLAEWMAIAASAMEFGFGILLIVGLFTRWVSIGSGLLLVSFGACMAISLGIHAPLAYSVFTAAAASFLLATIPNYKWSVDDILGKKKTSIISIMQLN